MQRATPRASSLSAEWAFVVQLRTNSEVGRGWVEGRVEHVVSGQATRFAGLQELLDFMARVLTPPPPARRVAQTRTTEEGA